MSVEDLINMLGRANPKDEVKCFDPNSGQLESITGMTYGGNDGIVEFYTDDIDD